MELGALVAEAFLASAEGTEVLGGLGDHVIVEGEINSAGLVWARSVGLRYDGDVKILNKPASGQGMRSPLTSFVGFEFASRTGPCQVTSK